MWWMGELLHGKCPQFIFKGSKMMRKKIKLESRNIGDDSPIFIIAEIGINHNGSFSDAENLIASAKEAGADAVKFQTYITEKRVAKDSPIFEILKQCELPFDKQEKLFQIARDADIIPFSTPFDYESIDFLESIHNSIYKIASFDSVNKQLLRKVGETGKPIIMSTGMTSLEELGQAWTALGGREDGTGCELALLHCVSSYPTPADEANLSMIPLLKSLHGGPVGYSDHTLGLEIPIMAVAAGAQIIEKHFTLDTKTSGPDHAMSADPQTLKAMVSGIRRMEKILGTAKMRIREIETSAVAYRRPSA